MKKPKKTRQGIYLQKSNKRWKWMAAASAATAAGVSASQASLVTVNLTNNYISAAGGNHLNADLTGDGHPDLTIADAFNSVFTITGLSGSFSNATVNINGIGAGANFHSFDDVGSIRLGSRIAGCVGCAATCPTGTASLTGSIPIFFKDLHINGGTPTGGSSEVTVSVFGAKVQLDSFTYNTPGQGSRSLAAPDQGSSLALLAMGAGGVLALRRWRAAQGRA